MKSTNHAPAGGSESRRSNRTNLRRVFSRTVTTGLAFALAFNAPLSMPGEKPSGLAYAATISVDGSAGDWDGSDLASGSGTVLT